MIGGGGKQKPSTGFLILFSLVLFVEHMIFITKRKLDFMEKITQIHSDFYQSVLNSEHIAIGLFFAIFVKN